MTPKRSPFSFVLASSLLLSGLLVAAPGCKPKAGGSCGKEGETRCTGGKEALVCTNKKWEALPCRGLNGCMGLSVGFGPGTCTNDGFLVGEPCPGEEGNPACSTDKKAMLKCEGAHWKKTSDCGGQNGCVANAKGANCDQGVAAEGSACTADNEGNGSCSPDKKDLLVCKAGKLGLKSHCRGQHGCRQAGDKLTCDDSIAEVGDPCEDGHANPACSPDKKAFLSCKGGKMAKERDCKQCAVFLDHIDCK